MTKTEREKLKSEKAWSLGVIFGSGNPLEDVKSTEDMYRAAAQVGCPLSYFDVFKYGAQYVWRTRLFDSNQETGR